MISNLLKMLSYPFMQRALVVGILVSLCAALLGVSLVLKRYSMIGDGLSHVSFGALSVGSSAGRGFLRLPPLSNLKAGEVCKATMTFRVAFPNGAASDLLQIYPFVGGTGKILDCYVDGTKIDAPKNGDRWTAGTNIGLTATGMSQEKFLLYPSVDV